MARLMDSLRENPPTAIGGLAVIAYADYREHIYCDLATGTTSHIDLPAYNVLSFTLAGGAGVIIRPSGTEP